MPHYPSGKNLPNLSVDNVANRIELKDTTSYNAAGKWDQNYAPASTLADTVLAINNLVADIDTLSAVLPGISQASGSRTYTPSVNAGFTSLEQNFATQEYSRLCRRMVFEGLKLSQVINELTAQFTVIAAGTYTNDRYPSGYNRDGFALVAGA